MTFRPDQEIIVLNFLVDGERRDIGARYEGEGRGANKHNHVVRVMGTRVHVPLTKIVDAQEYWDAKRREKQNND
jgi:hypothetical protein